MHFHWLRSVRHYSTHAQRTVDVIRFSDVLEQNVVFLGGGSRLDKLVLLYKRNRFLFCASVL